MDDGIEEIVYILESYNCSLLAVWLGSSCIHSMTKLSVAYGLSHESYDIELDSERTLDELQDELDKINGRSSSVVKRYQFVADGGHGMLDITFERDDKIRDVAAFLESNDAFLRALPMFDSETFADALSVAQVGEVDVSVATNNAALNICPLCGLRFGTNRDTLVSGGACRKCLRLES